MSWSYHKDRYYSIRSTIEREYPKLLKSNPLIQHAVNSIRVAEAAIDAEMKRIEDEDESHDDD